VTAGSARPDGPLAWLITGASRGIGHALVAEALRRGDSVVAGAREPGRIASHPELLAVELDVTKSGQCTAAVGAALERFGRIDVVANVAGIGLVGAVEETSPALAREVMEVNFWGPVNLVTAALPTLRAQRSGHIVQVSSLSGRVSAPGVGFYAASKFALEGLSEALHAELEALGIHVTIVEPGGVRTDWAGSSLLHADAMLEYAETAGRTRSILARVDGQQPSTPQSVADVIADCVRDPAPPRRQPIGADAVDRITAALTQELEEVRRWS
jgi:NAD(P)-dependent dehydrogenase (short-subunit alcohol dehydrogenase family)